MTEQEVRDYVEGAFQALKSRGWYADGTLVRAANTETDITAFETRRSLKLPRLYRAYLQSWRRMVPQPDSGEQWDKEYQDLIRSTHDSFRLNALFQEEGDFGALWLELHCPPEAMEELDERIENLKESQEELNGPLPEESFRYLVPIGEWGAGWGPLCLDLSRPEEQVDLEDDSTWSLVWFDHEEFDWGAKYLGEDGLLHGRAAAPDFQTLLEWYFFCPAEAEFEAKTGIKPTVQWYKDGAKRKQEGRSDDRPGGEGLCGGRLSGAEKPGLVPKDRPGAHRSD